MNQRPDTQPTALIAGAGIGGLTAALCLLRHGWRVQVLEQTDALGEVGAGIQISPNACKVLDHLGLMEALRPQAVAPDAIALRLGSSGREIMRIPLAATSQSRWGGPYWHLHRADLLAALGDALQVAAPSALQLGWALQGVEQTPDLVTAYAADGRSASGHLLVGADGVRSQVRGLLFGAQPPRFTGNVAWRAVVPVSQLSDPPRSEACIWTGRGRHAVTYRLRGGALANFVGVVEQSDWQEESWTQRGSREQVLADFADFHPTVRGVIDAASTHYRWALFDRPALPAWHRGRITLLGDACHPMLPFLAQGAAQAIEDAWTLASHVSPDHPDARSIDTGLNHYFDARSPRTTRVQAESRANQRRFHQPNAAYFPLAVAARLMPGAILGRNDWLFGHDITQTGQTPT